MSKKNCNPKADRVTSGDIHRIEQAIRELVRATTADQLRGFAARPRRVLENATGYEHPEHARLRRLHEKAGETPPPSDDSDFLKCLREENGYLKIANEQLRATNAVVREMVATQGRRGKGNSSRNRNRGGVA